MDESREIRIRKAKKEDLETLRQFEQGVIATERPFDVTLKKGLIQYYDLEMMIDASHIELIVAECKGVVIGSGYARIEDAKPYLQHTRHAYLGFMYVLPDHRGKGVNQKIIAWLDKWAYEHQIDELRLDVYFNNEPAIRAYEKAGFTRHMIEMRSAVKGTGTMIATSSSASNA